MQRIMVAVPIFRVGIAASVARPLNLFADPVWFSGAKRSRLLLFALIALPLLLVGCGTYQLQGKVVRGPESRVQVVSPDDPRLDQRGIGGTRLTVTLDPTRLDNKRVGSGVAGGEGGFTVPVDAMGAGFLEHQVQVNAVKEQYTTATRIMPLPSQHKRLLITLTPGRSEQPRRKGQALEETLEMGEPYLNEPSLNEGTSSP